jgi:hypothetical protein
VTKEIEIVVATLAALVFATILFFGFRFGRMRLRFGTYDRAEEPVMFWIGAVANAVFLIFCIAFLVRSAFLP